MTEYTVDPEKFADLVIEKWQTEIETLGITDTRTVLNSFKASVQRDAGGEPKIITFIFDYYGKFLEMGVFGSGHRKNKTNVKHFRQKYPWYSSIFARQVRRLADLMARQYGYESVTSIAESIQNKKP
jgi:hypothetical protein